jgi:hypothetical protein
MAFSTSALDTLSSASLSNRVVRYPLSLTRRVALSHAATAYRAKVSTTSIAMTWAASTAVSTSCARVTSASSAGTTVLP